MMANAAVDQESNVIPLPLAIATGLGLIAALYLIFIWAPMEKTMGVVQRIFYFHLPSAFVAFVAFIIGGINEPNAGTKIIGAFLGTGSERKGKAVAIWIPDDSLKSRTLCARK